MKSRRGHVTDSLLPSTKMMTLARCTQLDPLGVRKSRPNKSLFTWQLVQGMHTLTRDVQEATVGLILATISPPLMSSRSGWYIVIFSTAIPHQGQLNSANSTLRILRPRNSDCISRKLIDTEVGAWKVPRLLAQFFSCSWILGILLINKNDDGAKKHVVRKAPSIKNLNGGLVNLSHPINAFDPFTLVVDPVVMRTYLFGINC